MKKTIYIATSNAHKLSEFSEMFAAEGIDCAVLGARDLQNFAPPVENGKTFAENALMLWMAAFIGASCYKLLSIHFVKPPAEAEGRVGAFINAGLAGYAQHYGLSARETEVLRMVLEGKDNQNIASEMHLALGTVKSHTHNIFKKTGTKTRQELLQQFWRS